MAITDLKKVIELKPDDFTAYRNLAIAYTDNKEYDLAIGEYTRGIEMNPKYEVAYKERADLYEKKGDMERARADRAKVQELSGRKN